MDIEKTSQINKIDINKLYQILENMQDNETKNTNSNQTKNLLPPEFMAMFKNLDKNTQKMLINIWTKMNLPFKKTIIDTLIHIINQKPDISSDTLIKVFAFLQKNNLPLTYNLIEDTAENLNQEKSLSKIIEDIINNEVTDKSLDKLSLKPEQSSQHLLETLKNYPEQLKQVIHLVQNQENEGQKKLYKYLLGQQVINYKDSSEKKTLNKNNTLLLGLEIPLLLPEKEKPIPLYLQISNQTDRDKNKQSKSKDNNYKISFIIELEKRGPIRADIEVKEKYIHCQFWTVSDSTVNLIESKFSHLVENLQKIGFQVDQPIINKLDENELKNTKKMHIDSLFENISSNKSIDYQHIDFTV